MNEITANNAISADGMSAMTDDLEHECRQVVNAVEDVLRTPLNSAAKMDVDGAAMLITEHVFYEQTEPPDAQRYEWYYVLLGKSVSIAQGWKQNFAGALNMPSETSSSLIEYIDSTYGTNACKNAGIMFD